MYYKQELVEVLFRQIVADCKDEPDKQKLWLISNEFDLYTKKITDTCRLRWNIEVFFQFIKSHLVSLNKNSIEVSYT